MKDDNKRIESIVNELLAPTNQKKYKEVLNKKINEEDSLYMDNWVKFIEYENKQRGLEEQLQEIIKEKDNRVGMRFEPLERSVTETIETVDISKYRYEFPTDEEQLEIDILTNKIDIEDSKLMSDDEELLLSGICVGLETERDILISEEIRNHLLERFHHFPLNVNEIDDFYKEHDITLEIPQQGWFYSVYILKIKGEIFKTFEVILNSDSTDEGLLLKYKIITH